MPAVAPVPRSGGRKKKNKTKPGGGKAATDSSFLLLLFYCMKCLPVRFTGRINGNRGALISFKKKNPTKKQNPKKTIYIFI